MISTDPGHPTLLPLPAAAVHSLALGDLAAADAVVPVTLTPYLVSADRIGLWRMRSRQLLDTPGDLPWITGLVVAGEQVVGAAGFHAAPDDRGMVEIGYGIDPQYRRRGHARAALEAMLARARREPVVTVVRACVRPDNTPSLNLLAQYGFRAVGEQWDDEDGLETVFEVDPRDAHRR